MIEDNLKAIAIVVVSFNTRKLLLACIESIYKNTQCISFEVIVVDNNSSDGSATAMATTFSQASLVATEKNLGFAKANNLVAQGVTSEYILLLNPDTLVSNFAIDKLAHFANEHPEFGIYGGRTLFADGSLNPTSCWRMPTVWNSLCRALGLSALAKDSSLFSGDMYGGWRRDTVREVDIVSGCFLLIRRELWERLGGFDTSYFMYGEDWDLCLRARALGAKCLFCPDAEIIHYGGASEPVRADKLVRLFQTRVKLYRTHWGPVRSRVLIGLLGLWALRSMVQDGVLGLAGSEARRTSSRAWREVLSRRGEWLAG